MHLVRALLAFLAPFLFLLAALHHVQPPDPTIVKTDSDSVLGTVRGGVISWKGIPFAAPPVGKLLWRVPQPPPTWVELRDATQLGPARMQTDEAGVLCPPCTGRAQ
jgi:Carboxylesterase family